MADLQGVSRRTRWRIGLVTAGVTTALVGAGAVVAVNANAAVGCKVVYSAPNEWPGGFIGDVAVTNLGDPVKNWTVTWAFPAGQKVTHAWNAAVTQSGDNVTAKDAGYNAAIGTNGTVSFGFNGSWSGSNTKPTSFKLNGATCTGNVGQTSPPPVSPPPVSPPPVSPPPVSPPPVSPPPAGSAMAFNDAMQPGWNLGNSLDAVGADETAWGNPKITRELIRSIRAQGFKSIRVPVTWTAQHPAGEPYAINAAYLSRVKEVVDWSLAEGFYVMINIHHDSWQWTKEMPANREAVTKRFNALWTQIAGAFKDYSAKVTFESLNEPQFANAEKAAAIPYLDELNTSFHKIVRGSGGTNATRMLVIPTLHTSSEQYALDGLASWINRTGDKNIIATVHYYGYWPFSVNIAGGYQFNTDAQKDLTDTFDRLSNTFVSKGIPVNIGEYGLLGFDRHTGTIEQGEKLKFFEMFGNLARTKRVTTMWWDNGQHFNRLAFTWKDPELYAQIKSSWSTRSGTASSDLLFLPKTGTIAAKSLTLNLNGTTFVGLRQGTTDLVRGTDYTVSGDQLTLTASALTRLAGNRAYGVNATLHARFSQGVPWRINVISSDTPVLSNATGTTAAFAVPTQFRGDQLATMEAKYADGTNAGPQDWTSFKEFDATFAPDYAANVITLKPDFFAAVGDGRPVNLTFHFWSGAKVAYTITKSGNSVTGTKV